ncbi:hypothetical protein MHH60_05115 [Paenibacillus sp. FSL H7-0716]|uniref:hypothetical protein n=1 Tax=Paenibacillus TaxID=44249 RepID=UPI0013A6E504|nr:hypothetical protein [Paenibacillus odorifer]
MKIAAGTAPFFDFSLLMGEASGMLLLEAHWLTLLETSRFPLSNAHALPPA